ncbi:MAG: hypothetical protein BV459_03870 [Thermoplasmata archaeon M11B2D]|nr:MAG: hypothetical protein BV459_03870 [Thermoplasmata archaeon M11B2D]PNX52791.1 MAG: hypothetical protein BV458_07740 [Thermoplasmata archaeon M9B2D]
MITTVTTTTTTTVVTTTTVSVVASLALIGTITLIFFLIAKMLLSSHPVDRTQFLSNRLNIAIIPFLLMFALIVIVKIVDVLGF